MRTVLTTILGLIVMGQVALADSKELIDFDSLSNKTVLEAGQYVIDFTSDLSNCMIGAMNVTSETHLLDARIVTKFEVSEPVLQKGIMKPAVCVEGYDTAKAYVMIPRTTTVYAPNDFLIKRVRKIVQTTTASASDTNETVVDAGEYIVSVVLSATDGCFEELNFNYDYSFNDLGKLESIDVSDNGGVYREIPTPCMIKNSEAVGTVYVPRGPITLKSPEGSTMKLKKIDTTIVM